jgi:uncharacterized protein (TIGR02145 family)
MKGFRHVWILAGVVAGLLAGCNREPVNQPPVASFTISPETGDTETGFVLDATSSHDPDDPDSTLWVRWDFDSDGIYDWLFVQSRVNIHVFPTAGLYLVKLQVKDPSGATAEVTRELIVEQGNAPPLKPFAPNPRDSSNHIRFSGRLSWVAIDPHDDPLTYDLYMGTSEDPPLLEEHLMVDEYYPQELIPGQKYYWKVVARDPGGLTATSDVWRFSIHSGIYTRDTLTDPRDGQKYPVILLNRVWWMTRNLRYNLPGSFCYDNDPKNCEEYGRLYDTGIRDTVACPKGWKLPSDADWAALEVALGMPSAAYDSRGWIGNDQAYQMAEGGTSGLELQFGGYYDGFGNFKFLNDKGFYAQGYYQLRMIIRNYGQIYRNNWYSDNFRDVGFTPVRCIKKD